TCTTAGCELNTAGLGVCVQAHLFASNSTPCADTDGNACTTAGCDGAGTCDQNHSVQVCTTEQGHMGCDTTTRQRTAPPASTWCDESRGQGTPEPESSPRRRSSDLTCTTAGCELNTAGLGVCVQAHLFASNSTPCADSDGNACTTAGCNGAGTCDQNHSVQVCTTDQCNKGCDTTTGDRKRDV